MVVHITRSLSNDQQLRTNNSVLYKKKCCVSWRIVDQKIRKHKTLSREILRKHILHRKHNVQKIRKKCWKIKRVRMNYIVKRWGHLCIERMLTRKKLTKHILHGGNVELWKVGTGKSWKRKTNGMKSF